jgi:hypothetical protein
VQRLADGAGGEAVLAIAGQLGRGFGLDELHRLGQVVGVRVRMVHRRDVRTDVHAGDERDPSLQ